MRTLLLVAVFLAGALAAGAQDDRGGGAVAKRAPQTLCDKCAGMMYTADVGVCTACGGATNSGAFKLCVACALKKGQCQHCLAPLGPVTPVATGPAEVTLATDDGFQLAGTYLPAAAAPAKGVVILIHMLNRTRADWASFASALGKAGHAVLAYDMRGHGTSTGKGGKTVVWKDFSDADFAGMVRDVVAARAYLAGRADLAGKPVVIVGGSIGANLAVIYAAENPDVAGVALLSPGLDYHKVMPEAAVKKYGKRPILFAASEDDEYSANSVKKLADLAQGDKVVKIYKKAGHGTQMFGKEDDHPGELAGALVEWVTRVAGAAGGGK